jgi:hypothetical protein
MDAQQSDIVEFVVNGSGMIAAFRSAGFSLLQRSLRREMSVNTIATLAS